MQGALGHQAASDGYRRLIGGACGGASKFILITALIGQRRKTLRFADPRAEALAFRLYPFIAGSSFAGRGRVSLRSAELLRWPRFRGPTTMRPRILGRELAAAREPV